MIMRLFLIKKSRGMEPASFVLDSKTWAHRSIIFHTTTLAYVITFITAFLCLVVAWNMRNIQWYRHKQRAQDFKGKVLFVAILAAIACLCTLVCIGVRFFLPAHAHPLRLGVFFVLIAAALASMSVLLFYVYAQIGSGKGTREKQLRLLKAVLGLGTLVVGIILFMLFFSVGFSRMFVAVVLSGTKKNPHHVKFTVADDDHASSVAPGAAALHSL
jgi:uncharacterized membrane protein YidH (DUF202 family)